MESAEIAAEVDRKETIETLRRIADDLEKGCNGFDWLIGFDFTGGHTMDIQAETERLKSLFPDAAENKLLAMESLIEQAAYLKLYLKRLNQQAMISGLVQVHPENAKLQRSLPVSGEITKHSATLTSIMDKLMKHLAVDADDEDDGLDEYE